MDGAKTIILPEYDTAFVFDKTNQVAMVGNKSEFNKHVNPLTGEEEAEYDYFYINSSNQKIKVKDENFPDSISTLPDQQELSLNYCDNSPFFKVIFQNKVFLFSKSSNKQLSDGFDDIYQSKFPLFYVTENYAEVDKKPVRIKGLIDTTGKTIIKNKYHDITINMQDSVIYCCSAVFSNKLNDDVFNFNGKMIYYNKKHIEFSTRNIHVLKTYDPSESFIVENDVTKKNYSVDGEQFVNLKNNKAIIVKGENWILVDLPTGKEKKINKDKVLEKLNFLLE